MTLQTAHEIGKFLGSKGYVSYLRNYEKTDEYLVVHLNDVPLRIEKGNDEFYYDDNNGNVKLSLRKLWYVFDENNDSDVYIKKGYRCIKKAITEALDIYRKNLMRQLTNADIVSAKFKGVIITHEVH